MHDDPGKPAPINPFHSAMTRRVPVVMVSLRVDDVLSVAPWLGKEKAAELINSNAAVIAHIMLTAGTAAAMKLVEGLDCEN
jgi:hypothetical protein